MMKDWTIMVYFAGDNNLTTEMAYALERMEAITRESKHINLYVYFDGLSSDVPTLYCDFSDPKSQVKFYRSFKVEKKLIKVSKKFNENSASMNNIINFVHWCVKRDRINDAADKEADTRKNKKYAMIFSGHSFGFLDWGLFKDINSDYSMTLNKLQWLLERITAKKAVLQEIAKKQQAEESRRARRNNRPYNPWSPEKIKERTTELLGKPLDLLGFDSCEMSTLEIGSQFKGLTRTLVASEGSVPNAGWNYAQILLEKIEESFRAKKNKHSLSAKELAVNFVDGFIKQQNKFALADISVDMASWDLEALPELQKSFAELADNLLKCFKNPDSFLYNQMRRLLVNVHWQCQTYLLEQHIDLVDFCQLLIKEIELLDKELKIFPDAEITPIIKVGEACHKVIESNRKCILLTGFSGSDLQFSNGISLFSPWHGPMSKIL